MSKRVGTLIGIDPKDPLGPCLVQFEDGLQYRYHFTELRSIDTEPRGLPGDDNLKTA
jgi:hypothetical protein